MPDQALEWVEADGTVTAIRLGASIHIAEGISGRFGPSTQFVVDQVPLQPGQRFRYVRHGLAAVAVPVIFSPASPAAGRTLLRQWARRLDPVRGDGKLRVTGPGGDVRELLCRYASGLDSLTEDFQSDFYGEARAVLRFTTEQPYWQDASDTVQTWAQGAPVSFFPIFPLRLSSSQIFADTSIDNSAGQVDAWPVWKITGPGNNPVIRDLTTGRLLSLPLALTAGEFVTVDTWPAVGDHRLTGKTVTKQDGSSLFGKLTSDSTLFPLTPMVNTIRLEMSATTAASAFQLNWRKRYLTT